jgi:very-short-patch-repair endonuclease
MAKLFTRREAIADGISDRRLERGVERGRYVRLAQGVYFMGGREPTDFERRLAEAMRNGRPVSGELAAALYGFDGLNVPVDGDYSNVPVVSAHDALIALAATTTDVCWEWALEWALRKQYTTIAAVEDALMIQRRGNGCIRRVLELRPSDAPPTGSVLETIAVQLIRQDSRLPTPTRQVEVLRAFGLRPAYVDLAWPQHGVFLELDGEQHKDQPRYDATRQTAVIATTGWLVGRYAWTDIVHHSQPTLRSIGTLFETAKKRQAS